MQEELRGRSGAKEVAHLSGPCGQLVGHCNSFARYIGTGRRRVDQQILHGAEQLLLVLDPLRRAAEGGGDLVDTAREHRRIHRERRLLANQLDLLLDAHELRVDIRQLAIGLPALGDALAENLDLPFDASTQLAIQLFVDEPALESCYCAWQLLHERAFAVHFLDGMAHEQQPQVHPIEPGEAIVL